MKTKNAKNVTLLAYEICDLQVITPQANKTHTYYSQLIFMES